MSRIWLVADWHLGHDKSLTWEHDDGTRCRPFDTIGEYHNILIENHNALVSDDDRVYVLGDAVIKKSALSLVREFKGKKTLISGNHDIFSTKEYLAAGFKNVRGVRVLTEYSAILSHIPIHPDSLTNRKLGQMINYHGHLHSFQVELCTDHIVDDRYRCVSVEQTNYCPVLLLKQQGGT
jgi:calcineurin-like phosphoesterase family protein